MPIKFEIYRDGKRVTDFTPQGAIAIGPESVPIPGEVVFRDGYLIAEKADEHASHTIAARLSDAPLWPAAADAEEPEPRH